MSRKHKKQLIDRAHATRAGGYEFQAACDEALLLRGNVEEARFYRKSAHAAWDLADQLFERAQTVRRPLPKARRKATAEFRNYCRMVREVADDSIEDRDCRRLAGLMMKLDRLDVEHIDPKDKKRNEQRVWYVTLRDNEEFEIKPDGLEMLTEMLAEELANPKNRFPDEEPPAPKPKNRRVHSPFVTRANRVVEEEPPTPATKKRRRGKRLVTRTKNRAPVAEPAPRRPDEQRIRKASITRTNQ